VRPLLLVGLSIVVFANAASAAVLTLRSPTVSVGIAGNPVELTPEFVPNEDGKTFTSVGQQSWATFAFDWNITVDPDPFISAGFSVINNAAIPQTFVVGVLLPIIPQLPLTLHGGSVGVSLTDANFNAVANLVDAGLAVFQGQIDGVTVLELFDDPYGLATPPIPGFTVSDADAAGLGPFGPFLPSGPATATIGIVHTFTLSPGDRAAFTSFFIVEAIPEVGTLAFCGIGALIVGGGLASRVRRRLA